VTSAEPEPLVVPETLEGERLDRTVAMLTGWSRAEVQTLVRDGGVLVNGAPASKSHRLHTGEVIELLERPPVAEPPTAEPVPLAVVHADDAVIVVDKPAGLVVHPGPGHAHGTLVHGLLHDFPDLASVGDPERPGIVHRLDRDTSGLLVVARTDAAYRALVDALSERVVDRRYLALVGGIPEARRGAIDAPIGRSTRHRTRMAVRQGGRPARTAYEVRAEWPERDVALLECRLESGRTHQIRVHLAAIGHPVVGDVAYGGRSGADLGLGRPFLHATTLGFDHPVDGRDLTFESPLPVELARVLDALGEPATD
jgi:23S rRNA pseudouridine1911/1915/1917 synthase